MNGGQFKAKYTDAKRIEVLAALEKNGGAVAKTSRETGVGKETIRRWRDEAKSGVAAHDLKRFTKDSWDIIHRANEVVREKVEDLGAKDAASIASSYFDRQAKAGEQISSSSDQSPDYVAQWDTARETPDSTAQKTEQ